LLPFEVDSKNTLSKWRVDTFYNKEPETIEWIKYFANSGPSKSKTLIDVGANIGLYSLFWLSLRPDLKCIAIEPFEQNFRLLIRNISLNNFEERIIVLKQPLYSEATTGIFNVTDNRPSASSYKFELQNYQKIDTSDLASSITIDHILESVPNNVIVKIDVDGNDFEVLKGAKLSLKKNKIQSVLIESSVEIQVEIESFLKYYGFDSDPRFNLLKNHSDLRRIANKKIERNRVYTNLR
jgi:FkbM family methyltransferase